MAALTPHFTKQVIREGYFSLLGVALREGQAPEWNTFLQGSFRKSCLPDAEVQPQKKNMPWLMNLFLYIGLLILIETNLQVMGGRGIITGALYCEITWWQLRDYWREPDKSVVEVSTAQHSFLQEQSFLIGGWKQRRAGKLKKAKVSKQIGFTASTNSTPSPSLESFTKRPVQMHKFNSKLGSILSQSCCLPLSQWRSQLEDVSTTLENLQTCSYWGTVVYSVLFTQPQD